MKEIRKKLVAFIGSKRMLYTFCFILLNLIDMIYNTQNGDVWSVAVNCSGLVFMIIVASAYSLKEFCNVFNYVWSGLCLAVMLALFLPGQNHIGGVYIWALEAAVLNVWWIGILARHIFIKIFVKKTIHFRPNLSGRLWIVMTMCMTASVSGRIWPLWYLLMFGIFYLSEYKKDDMADMQEGMINGTIAAFFCLQIYAYGFRPFDVVRYTGAYANSNIAGLHYLTVYVMVLFKLHLLEKRGGRKGWKLFYLIGAGGLLVFQFLTLSRTALVCSVIITLLYGILVIKNIWMKKWRTIIAGSLLMGLLTVCLFPIVFSTVRWFPTVLHHPVWYMDEYTVNKVHSFDPPNSTKYTEIDEFLEHAFQRIIKKYQWKNPFVLEVKASTTMEKAENSQLDSAFSGRISIYKTYIRDLSWFGHGKGDGYYTIGNGKIHTWHAQNLWLQIAYYFGIPAGIFLIVLSVVIVWGTFRKMSKSKENEFAIIPFFICMVFFMFGMMEMVWNPGQFILFLIFFVQHKQIDKELSKVAN